MSEKNIREKISDKLGSEVKYVSQVDEFLNNLITSKYIDPKYESGMIFSPGKLTFCRGWNSYYPSYYNVKGGCYVINYKWGYTVIDPGYRTIQALIENNIDTRMIKNIIITHDHEDHIGGLRELLDLLYRQNKNTTQKCVLYVNPGARREYKHFTNKNLEVKKIRLRKEIILDQSIENRKIKELFSFIGYRVFHTGINKKQKSIGLIFRIEKNNETLRFGITSDLDGNKKYMHYYKKIFNNLYFLIVHLGSLKYKDENETNDKHLYPDGLYRLIKTLDNVKGFIIQELGLEIASPNKLTNLLSNVVFHNGFFFPYIIYSLSKQRDSEDIVKKLIPHMMYKFLENFNINLREKVIQFSCALCLDVDNCEFDTIENRIGIIKFFNLWNLDLDQSKLSEIKEIFNNYWNDLRKYIYYNEISTIRNFNEYYDKINKLLNEENFCQVIIKNSKYLISKFSQELKKRFFEIIDPILIREDIIGSFGLYRFISTNMYNEFIHHLLRYPLDTDSRYISSIKDNQMKILIFPFLIFIHILNDFNDFKTIESYQIQKKLLDTFKKFFPEKEIYIGKYGRKIDFNMYFSPFKSQKIRGECKECRFEMTCSNPKDGKYLFDNYRKCKLDDLRNLEEEYYFTQEYEPDHPEITVEDMIEQEEHELKIQRCVEFNYEVFNFLLSKGDFESAAEVLRLNNMLPFLKFDQDYIKYLESNLDNKTVKEIILLFFQYPAKFFEPVEAYLNLFKLVHNIIREEISHNTVKFLYVILKNKFYFLIKYRFQQFFLERETELRDLKLIYKNLLKTICQYLLSKNEFSSEWSKDISYIRDIFAAIRDETILIELRSIIQSDFNYDSDEKKKGKQYRYVIDIFKTVDPILLSIFKDKYYRS